MRIGIDISQTAYQGTGVANYLTHLVKHLVAVDRENEYVLFFSSLRGNPDQEFIDTIRSSRVTVKSFKFPPLLLDFLWNRLHVVPVERFIGDVDVFISSDWTQPPLQKAKGVSILYDLIVYKYPEESHNQTQFSLKNLNIKVNIVAAQKRRLQWMKEECSKILCISEATKEDAKKILGIEEGRLAVIYPGFSL